MPKTLITTKTAGWYEDPKQPGKKVRKSNGDVVMTRAEYEAAQKGDSVAQKIKDENDTVILSSGKVASGKTVTITCAKRGCTEKRTIKPQDKFQVKFCVTHQREHYNQRRRERRAAKRKAQKANA